ncbi:(d)CMP kinase [Methylovulum psychrotolerans]|jgi:cytidylate kinase|uniref:Cytidylate kinase n=1 Tax=Methylovulum psychrotolerans TaxID=1704499 RepID=A0A1Z4C1R7_9GAMM|nr:(d)CMP kinase [Methylovulum psychrotolerans]ASF47454.1 cytidylate kinase [Methylovulum psychrotolerans]MBT9098969.1 (d)CMP kinase [Methylovulum psychrotolerans]POZ50283.1 (d)CMP kinase [Methylovulum psychrotolerans]
MAVPVLTIDGPSGAGKGTVSRLLAKRLGWHYLDSGSIYRSLAIAVLQQNVALDDVAAIVGVAQALVLAFECGDELVVKLNGLDITAQLGLETTGNAASIIAALPEVRAVLLQKQQDFKQLPGLVADGRDMGTVVFPDAAHKVFLTASSIKRAERRYKQLKEKGIDANLMGLAKDIEERDRRDRERATAPLSMASGALFIDSSEITIDAVITQILDFIR